MSHYLIMFLNLSLTIQSPPPGFVSASTHRPIRTHQCSVSAVRNCCLEARRGNTRTMGSSPTPIKTCSRPDPPSTPRYRSQNWETSRISRTYRRQVTSSLEADTETHIIGNRPLRRVATSSGANDLVKIGRAHV